MSSNLAQFTQYAQSVLSIDCHVFLQRMQVLLAESGSLSDRNKLPNISRIFWNFHIPSWVQDHASPLKQAY